MFLGEYNIINNIFLFFLNQDVTVLKDWSFVAKCEKDETYRLQNHASTHGSGV